jgi:hypothetical protein
MRTLLPLAFALAVVGCGDESEDTDRPTGGDHGDGGAGDAGSGDGGTPTEGDCTDGVDDDDDGKADCLDPDCAEVFECTWPDALDHTSRFQFDGNTIECQVWGVDVDYDVPDCTTALTASLTELTGAQACQSCDRSYSGAFTYTQDTCSELLGTTLPQSGAFGFVFVSETQRELWGQDEAGQWAFSSLVDSTDGRNWELTASEAVYDDPEDCDNGTQNLGTLTLTVAFVDQ